MLRFFIKFLLIFLSVSAQKFDDDMKNKDKIDINSLNEVAKLNEKSYRLPVNCHPLYYSLVMKFGDFDKGQMNFSGDVAIEIRTLDEINEIILHSYELDIKKVSLIDGNTPIEIEISFDPEREFLIIKPKQILPKRKFYFIEISYSGSIVDRIRAGVYRGSYWNGSEQRFFLATHMQPGFFRYVSPSFDEPSFKAKFEISLEHPSQYKAISNGLEEPITRDSETDGRTTTIFKGTKLMSTYLLAFVISDFAMSQKVFTRDSDPNSTVLFRAFSTPDQISHTKMGLDVAVEALQHFENTFGVTYNFPKLDQVALPIFNVGGMENYGIIFYREDYFLYDPLVTTAYNKELAAATIVHEVCHKLFGNLVTPHWWSVLWLSEGFCRFYEYYMTEKIFPDMRMKELFAVEAAQSILYRDSAPLTTRPMTQYEETPERIAKLFDGIAYSKSASVFRMFFHSITETTFHKGLHSYLTTSVSNHEGIAEPEQLYDALQSAIDEDEENRTLPEDFQTIFKSWELNAGYPIVYVERSYNDQRIKFTQNRFTDTISGEEEEWNTIWYIPITYASKANPSIELTPKFWLDQRNVTQTLTEVSASSYFIVNVQQTGYYRVQYDDANWMLIADELSTGNFSNIPPNTRAMLIDDAGVFFESKILNLRIFLELIKYLEHDIDYIPWMAGTNNLIYIRRMLDDDNNFNTLAVNFKKFLQILLEKTFNTFGTDEKDGEEHYHKHIRNIAINWACQAHMESCLNQTRGKILQLMDGTRTELSKDHEEVILCNGLLNASESEYRFIWSKVNEITASSSRRRLYLRSLGCIENELLLMRLITAINDHPDEWRTIITAVYSNGPIGMRVTMRFLRFNYQKFIAMLIELELNVKSEMRSIFERMAARITNENSLNELKELFVIYDIDSVIEEEIVAIAERNLKWMDSNSGVIRTFLDDFFEARKSASSSQFLLVYTSLMIFLSFLLNWIM